MIILLKNKGGFKMANFKTLEDLAMSLVRDKHGDLYDEKILHLFNKVKEVIKEQMSVPEDRIGYGTLFIDDINADPMDRDLITIKLENVYNIRLPFFVILLSMGLEIYMTLLSIFLVMKKRISKA